MKLLSLPILIALIFGGSKIAQAVDSITVRSNLQFPTMISASSKQTYTLAPTDSGAAVFDITGTPNAKIVVSVVESSIVIDNTACAGSCSTKETLTVKKFKRGGSVNNKGKGRIDATGSLTNIRIGAKVIVRGKQVSGDYVGFATIRIVYQ